MADSSSSMEHASLDQFYPYVISKESSVRSDWFPTIEDYLSDRTKPTDCDDLTGFLNGLLKWIESSNYRVRFLFFSHFHRASSRLDFLSWSSIMGLADRSAQYQ
jgi:hypothetical protein